MLLVGLALFLAAGSAHAQTWTPVPAPVAAFKQIVSVDSTTAWALGLDGKTWQWKPSGWVQRGCCVSQISVAADGTMWAVNPPDSNRVLRWDGTTWQVRSGALINIAVGRDGTVWGLGPDTKNYKLTSGFFTSSWDLKGCCVSQLAVGSDGDLWAVNPPDSNRILHWNGSTWVVVPGGLTQISVGNSSQVWGVSAGHSYHWNGSTWIQGTGTLKQISAASDGTLWGLNPEGTAWTTAYVPSTTPSSLATLTPHCAGGRHVFSVQLANAVSSLEIKAMGAAGLISDVTYSTATVPNFFAAYPELNFNAAPLTTWVGAAVGAPGSVPVTYASIAPECPAAAPRISADVTWNGSYDVGASPVVVFAPNTSNLAMPTPTVLNQYLVYTVQSPTWTTNIAAATKFWLVPLPQRTMSLSIGTGLYRPFALQAANGKWVRAGVGGSWTLDGSSISDASGFVTNGTGVYVTGASAIFPVENAYGNNGVGFTDCGVYAMAGVTATKCPPPTSSSIQIRGAP